MSRDVTNPTIRVQRSNKHSVRIGSQRIARKVGGRIDLVGAPMNITRHDDQRSSPPLSKLYFFNTLITTSGCLYR
jgi:hypothetical protein